MACSDFDAIVIGSGIAGMMAATELNARNRRVLVLEHNHQAGGLMSGIRRRGFYFDVGCQSTENMGILFPLLEQYGIAPLAKFRRVKYRVKMPGADFEVESLGQALGEFQKSYPELAPAFSRVFATHKRTSKLIRKLSVPERIPWVVRSDAVTTVKWLARMLAAARESLPTLLLEDFTKWYERMLPPSVARDLLSRCGYTRMNVFVASAFWHLWAEDYWYPEGGFQAWFDRWVEELERRGVVFKFKSTVTAFERTGRRLTAVVTGRGERFDAPQVIYAGDYKKAVELVGREQFAAAGLRRLESAKHSDAMVSVYIGLGCPPSVVRERLKSDHVFYFPDRDCRTFVDPSDAEAHRRSFLEVTAHGMQDPSLAPEGKCSVVLQAFSRIDWCDAWSSSDRETYKATKARVAEELISRFEGLFPGVRKYIEYVDVGSPHSAVRFTRNHEGGTCGFELNWKNFPFRNPLSHVKSPLANLHMAGHFTVWPGAVPTAALSGKIAAVHAHRKLEAVR